MVDYAKLATPAIIEYFTSRPGGRMYGLAASPECCRKLELEYVIDTRFGGLGSEFIETAPNRSEVFVRLPVGDFVLRQTGRRRVFVATETGPPFFWRCSKPRDRPPWARGTRSFSAADGRSGGGRMMKPSTKSARHIEFHLCAISMGLTISLVVLLLGPAQARTPRPSH